MLLTLKDYARTQRILQELLPFIDEEEIQRWLEHYDRIVENKDYIILLLRAYGMSYGRIRSLINVSPNRITKVLREYEIDQEDVLFQTKLEGMEEVEEYLTSEGVLIFE